MLLIFHHNEKCCFEDLRGHVSSAFPSSSPGAGATTGKKSQFMETAPVADTFGEPPSH